ncbi:hypothetical protein [Gymnodinialimonas sp.]
MASTDSGSRNGTFHTDVDGDTGAWTTTTSSTTSDSSGQTVYSSHTVTCSEGEGKGQETSSTHTEYNPDGSVKTKRMETSVTDAEGNTVEASTMTKHEDGSTTTQTVDADGNVTTVKKDKDGNVISEETLDPDGKTIEQEKTEFWDADLIYGDHSDPFQGKDMTEDMKMLIELDPSAEMYVDHFDFIM